MTVSVLVIGAGMAGLTAARRLQRAGLIVKVVEARERIGGRTWTSKHWPDAPLDLGASWIHGVHGNPLTELADKLAVVRTETDYKNTIFYDIDGRPVNIESMFRQFDSWRQLIANRQVDHQNHLADVSDVSDISDVSIEGLLRPELENASERDRRWLNFFLNMSIEQEWAADVGDLSANQFEEGDLYPGPDVIFPEGYVQLVNHLAQDLDIELNCPVETVLYGQNGVEIICKRRRFSADYALVTLPVGVLRSGRVRFAPELPQEKRAAIESFGSGVLNKVYLRFERPFWPEGIDWFGHATQADPTRRGEWAIWFNLLPSSRQPILLAFNAGRFGLEIEGWSDRKIVAEGVAALRRIFGDVVSEPIDFQITRWGNDPFARGSYSSAAVGMASDARQRLAQPVGGRLFFAGEATHQKYMATVHGALLSGRRAADELLKNAQL